MIKKRNLDCPRGFSKVVHDTKYYVAKHLFGSDDSDSVQVSLQPLQSTENLNYKDFSISSMIAAGIDPQLSRVVSPQSSFGALDNLQAQFAFVESQN